jgi:hypothetical protein
MLQEASNVPMDYSIIGELLAITGVAHKKIMLIVGTYTSKVEFAQCTIGTRHMDFLSAVFTIKVV